jgi:hypothetical protein
MGTAILPGVRPSKRPLHLLMSDSGVVEQRAERCKSGFFVKRASVQLRRE